MKLQWTEPELYKGPRRLSAADYQIVEDQKAVKGGPAPDPSWIVSCQGRPIGQARTLKDAKALAQQHHGGR